MATTTAATTPPSGLPSDPNSPTGKLCSWVSELSYDSIPEELRTRARYLILDGLACALVGAHLPWSEKAADALLDLELAGGTATVIGYRRRINALNAAMLNSSFIQGFELDDWHVGAPLHSNSIILPALLAVSDHVHLRKMSDVASPTSSSSSTPPPCSGKDFIVAYIAGLEVGPRVGLALHGAHMLSMGWHSGAVFGPPASAAAAGKLLGLSAGALEDAMGIACTQAGGLMSAQFESEVKRMQHGFAARNGLLGALLARAGYVGIKRVLEREYGGFLAQFSRGNGMDPPFQVAEIARGLGQTWQTSSIAVKPYASMASTHNTVDCLADLRQQHPDALAASDNIQSIEIALSRPAFEHGGWQAARPLTATGAQMSNAYVAATYLVDEAVMPAQFAAHMLSRDEVWGLVDKITCTLDPDFAKMRTRVTVRLHDRAEPLVVDRALSKSIHPLLSNAAILDKWRVLTRDVIDAERRQKIEDMVLRLEDHEDLGALGELLIEPTKNPIA